MPIFQNLIDGEWVGNAPTFDRRNPSDTSECVGEFAGADLDQVNAAIYAAQIAQPKWRASGIQARSEILDRIGTLILQHKDDLGRLLSREEGKTLNEGIGEVIRAGQIFKFFAGEALRNVGDWLESVRPNAIEIQISREPVGVIGIITPWNFPIAIPAWKIAPALAFGNSVVLKPAQMASATAVRLVEIAFEAGIPAGVLNLVMGSGKLIGEAMLGSSDVQAISFTGSIGTGREIGVSALASGKKVQLEMGGKNPLIILDDADLDAAVEGSINSAFFSTGQRCTAASRLIVTDGIHDRFVECMLDRMTSLKVDHALSKGTDIGPVVDDNQLQKNIGYVDLASKEGAKIHGGEQLSRATNGYFMAPALLTNTNNAMTINREEVFGPVAAVIRATSYEEALQISNDTPFGLSAGIYTRSLKYANHFNRNAKAGMTMVNLPTAGVDYHVPFGGTKASSNGPREQGSYAREFFTTVKTSYIGA